jgi:hypothetical protein
MILAKNLLCKYASDHGIGMFLSQLDDLGTEKVIAYVSNACSPP